MRRYLSLPMLLILSLVIIWSQVSLADGDEKEAKTFDLVGANKCKMCHKSEAKGAQFVLWSGSRHAHAYEALASEKALAIATEKGIGNPQEAPQCLKCHVTAFPVLETIADQKITLEEGVSCESCHGAGSGYWKKATMAAVRADEIDAASIGLVVPTVEVCTGCHNEESPTFESFDFEKASATIAHPCPEGI
jgi:hypothetical protein